jgi:hypothetical protein
LKPSSSVYKGKFQFSLGKRMSALALCGSELLVGYGTFQWLPSSGIGNPATRSPKCPLNLSKRWQLRMYVGSVGKA